MTVFDDFLAASVPAGAVGLMWLGQATVALRVDGAVLLVDRSSRRTRTGSCRRPVPARTRKASMSSS